MILNNIVKFFTLHPQQKYFTKGVIFSDFPNFVIADLAKAESRYFFCEMSGTFFLMDSHPGAELMKNNEKSWRIR